MAAARGNRKRKRRRGRFAFLFRLLCVLALAAAVFFGATVFFQVGEITVSGNNHYDQEQVIRASGIKVGDNLYRMNKFEVRDAILEELPYVEDVLIRRSLPDTIVITVTEWAAVARIEVPERTAAGNDDGDGGEGEETPLSFQEIADQPWLISVGGKLLEVAPEDSRVISVTGITPLGPQPGTMLAVPQDEQVRLEYLLLLLRSLEEQEMLGKVQRISMESDFWLTMRYDGRFDVKIPLENNIPYHLQVLLETVKTREDYETGTMDLTQEDYAVVYTPSDAPPDKVEEPVDVSPEAPAVKAPAKDPAEPEEEIPGEIPRTSSIAEQPEAPPVKQPEPEAQPTGTGGEEPGEADPEGRTGE